YERQSAHHEYELNVPEYTFLTSLILSECHNNKRENDFQNEQKQSDNHVNHEISNSATNESANKILGNNSVSRVSLCIKKCPHLCEITLNNRTHIINCALNNSANLLEHCISRSRLSTSAARLNNVL